MIKSLAIKNFQSHKDTLIKFDPGVNVIVGSSDSGKTAIIRALRWLVWNRPTGDEMRSNWGGQTEVVVGFEDGRKVIRKKENNINEYHRFQENATGYHRVYKAFGTSVPEDIRKILNIREINLQQQLDNPFLLTSSPGEVAAHFNRIAGLDRIDQGIKQVNKWIRGIETTVVHKQQDVDKYTAQLEDFNHLEQFEADVEVLEEMEERRNKQRSKQLALATLLDAIEKTRELMYGLNEVLEDEELINNAYTLQQDIEEKEAKQKRLRGLIAKISARRISLAAHQDLIRRTQKRFDKEFPDICPLCNQPIKK
jgi:exonuclease SbcC